MKQPSLHALGDVLYFGKVPCRGDFVRSSSHVSLTEQLDQWQSQMLDRLAQDPRWKLVFDAAPAMPMAILGLGASVGLVAYWMPSQDASGRRFPFMTGGALAVDVPAQSIPLVPIAAARLWARLEQVAHVAHAATDMSHAQASLSSLVEGDLQFEANFERLKAFTESTTLAGLAQMLGAAGHVVDVRHALIALGTLLQPVLSQGAARMTKLLCLPLPEDPRVTAMVASWWFGLVTRFFERQATEFCLFIAPCDGRSNLILGFQGASATALQAVLDPIVMAQQGVFLRDLEWVDAEVERDYGLRKLSNYLRDPGLSLAEAQRIFLEVFLGV